MNKYQKLAKQISKYIALEMAIKYNNCSYPTNGRIAYTQMKKWPLKKILDFKKYNLECLNEAISEDLKRIIENRHYY